MNALLLLGWEMAFVLIYRYHRTSIGDFFGLSVMDMKLLFHLHAWLVILLLMRWLGPPSFKSHKRALPSILFVLGGLIFAGVASKLNHDIFSSIDPTNHSEANSVYTPEVSQITFLKVFLKTIMSPIEEELVMRWGWFAVLGRYMSRNKVLILSSLIFSVAHVDIVPSDAVLVSLFISGMVLGITYLALGLPWAIILHILHNSVPWLRVIDVDMSAAGILYSIFGIGIISLIVFLIFTFRYFRSNPAPSA